MPLEHNGLVKLAEECGELVQAAMKKIARSDGENIHWDDSNLRERLEDEIADVRAACSFVAQHFDLNEERMYDRYDRKSALFEYWHNGGTETAIPQTILQSNCPTCDSPKPKLHPAVQFEGEVSICSDAFHLISGK